MLVSISFLCLQNFFNQEPRPIYSLGNGTEEPAGKRQRRYSITAAYEATKGLTQNTLNEHYLTIKSPVGDISVVALIRTDTTFDHSQKAEVV